MSIYTISDLHLAFGVDKPMDIFGYGWENYMERTETNWINTVNDQDTVIIGGDISWGTYLDDIKPDFDFIESLPGKKILLKGNHDYWWESLTKLKRFTDEMGYKTIEFLHNTSILAQDTAICGTRGWIDPSTDNFKKDDEKIYLRELGRMELSLKEGIKYNPKKIIAVLHYPPVTKDKTINQDYLELFKKYSVSTCIYGHLHSNSHKNAFEGQVDNIEFKLVSADYVHFTPQKLT
ncbi:MAG: serine/threonine protein phosphatase [Ruminococcaceae bacterium]|nr:serine/threonine protein phosphatase [Oscillospiraceae bacterium]